MQSCQGSDNFSKLIWIHWQVRIFKCSLLCLPLVHFFCIGKKHSSKRDKLSCSRSWDFCKTGDQEMSLKEVYFGKQIVLQRGRENESFLLLWPSECHLLGKIMIMSQSGCSLQHRGQLRRGKCDMLPHIHHIPWCVNGRVCTLPFFRQKRYYVKGTMVIKPSSFVEAALPVKWSIYF